MISPELRARIRRMFYAEHWKMGTIAAELGVHRDTVALAVEPERFVNIALRPQYALLDPYKDFVRITLEQYPRLRATRLLQMIQPSTSPARPSRTWSPGAAAPSVSGAFSMLFPWADELSDKSSMISKARHAGVEPATYGSGGPEISVQEAAPECTTPDSATDETLQGAPECTYGADSDARSKRVDVPAVRIEEAIKALQAGDVDTARHLLRRRHHRRPQSNRHSSSGRL
jgi:hypothetical protein